LGAIKQYLCLSLLKNSASTQMIVFQLSCSIFMSLVARFRPGLKAEIGVFFPMIVLRVLENVAQPNFQQKMIVLRFLEKLCVDSQILVDIFINYDCDVHSSNIFERYLCTVFYNILSFIIGELAICRDLFTENSTFNSCVKC
jgi:brefeldin A-inhibited guanine nucleotide-exchange protein